MINRPPPAFIHRCALILAFSSTPPTTLVHAEAFGVLDQSPSATGQRTGMDPEIALFQKLMDQANMLATTGMTWWVSSVVLCGSILGAVWLKRNELIRSDHFKNLGIGLILFFLSIVIYGVWMIYGMYLLESETSAVLKSLKIQSSLSGFKTIQVAYAVGTTSFIFITILWCFLFRELIKKDKQETEHNKQKQPSPQAQVD